MTADERFTDTLGDPFADGPQGVANEIVEGPVSDYAIDFGREKAVFSAFRRTSEVPLYRIEKCPKLTRRQGAYSVVTATGLILKRGNDLSRVLSVLEKSVRLARPIDSDSSVETKAGAKMPPVRSRSEFFRKDGSRIPVLVASRR